MPTSRLDFKHSKFHDSQRRFSTFNVNVYMSCKITSPLLVLSGALAGETYCLPVR